MYHQFLLVENEMERATKEFLRSRNKNRAAGSLGTGPKSNPNREQIMPL